MAKKMIEPGMRFGKLTAVEKAGVTTSQCLMWRCRCDCGGEICADSNKLRNGKVTDCGCITKLSRKQIDLTGMRFGKLTALEPTKRRADGGSAVWKCKCDCGKEKEVTARRLRNGSVKSCGCVFAPPPKDYEGKRFGRLTVLSYEGKKKRVFKNSETTSTYWKCRCDCGNEIVTTQSELQEGNTVSCGCYKREVTRESLRLVDGTSITLLEANRKGLRKNNKSGVTGVYREGELWTARICFKRKKYWLGRYRDKEDAIRARKKAEEMHEEFLSRYYTEGRKLNEKAFDAAFSDGILKKEELCGD